MHDCVGWCVPGQPAEQAYSGRVDLVVSVRRVICSEPHLVS